MIAPDPQYEPVCRRGRIVSAIVIPVTLVVLAAATILAH